MQSADNSVNVSKVRLWLWSFFEQLLASDSSLRYQRLFLTCPDFFSAIVRTLFDFNDPQRTGRVSLTYDQLAHITIHLMDDKRTM